jgi:hypothetical protein
MHVLRIHTQVRCLFIVVYFGLVVPGPCQIFQVPVFSCSKSLEVHPLRDPREQVEFWV